VDAVWLRVFDRGGKILFALTACGVIVLELLINRNERLFALLLCGGVGFIGTTCLNAGIKWARKKERPIGEIKRTKNLLTPLMQYSFPSFHCQLGFCMTFIAGWFVYTIHWLLPIPLIIFALLTAYTRHALKAHDWIDIIAGGILGLITGFAICIFLGEVNELWLGLGAVVASIATFLYIPERYFSKKMRGEKKK